MVQAQLSAGALESLLPCLEAELQGVWSSPSSPPSSPSSKKKRGWLSGFKRSEKAKPGAGFKACDTVGV